MLQAFKSFLESHPAVHRLVLAVRSVILPTYSQLLQRLVRTAARNIDRPVFVKVGANDGITGDPFGDSLLINAPWQGLLIEPVPYCVERLASIYNNRQRFQIEQIAIGRTPGTARFYYVSQAAKTSLPDLPEWYDQLGSFDRQHIMKHFGGKIEPFILTMDIQVDSLANVLRKHGITEITLLHIDTEGYDLEVLHSLDLSEFHPECIMVEHRHLVPDDRSAMIAILKSNGYIVRDTGYDFFALHREANQCLHHSGRIGRIVNAESFTPVG